MPRAFIEELMFFLLPFLGFALFLFLSKRNPFTVQAWTPHRFRLAVAGLLCVIASLIVSGLFATRQTGAFQPAHMENGLFVPGRFR